MGYPAIFGETEYAFRVVSRPDISPFALARNMRLEMAAYDKGGFQVVAIKTLDASRLAEFRKHGWELKPLKEVMAEASV